MRHIVHTPPMPLRISLVAVVAAVVAPLIVVGSSHGQEPDEAQCPDPVPTDAQTEFEAIALAELCDAEVEIVNEQTPWGTSVARPDGTVKLTADVEPFRAIDESGEWAPIDTTLQADSDGKVRPVNSVSDMEFSGGGAGTLASLADGERSFSLTWPEELPEPELSGPSATYQEVLNGVDLVVTASAEGFSHDLVVKSAEAAVNPALDAIEFGFSATALDAVANDAGGIELTDIATGEAFGGAAPPTMWDASTLATEASGTQLQSETTESSLTVNEPVRVGAELEGSTLRLIPDQELLEGPGTVYPVTIDPTWAPDTNGWITVSSRYPNNSYWKTSHLTERDYFGDAGVGQACDESDPTTANCWSTPFRMRSYFRFDISTVSQDAYRIPKGGRVFFLQKHSALCDNGAMHLYRSSGFDSASGDTWNNQPTAYSSTRVTTPDAKHGRGGCGGAAYVDFAIGSYVQTVNSGQGKHLFVALRAPDESPSPDLRYWNRFDGSQSKIEVYYDVKPYAPKVLEINGLRCTSDPAAAPWINTRFPVLSAIIDSKDSMVKWQARVRESGSGGAVEFDWTSGALGATGARRSKTVTSSLPDDDYYWLARSISTTNSAITSSWTDACRFNVDGTNPSTPSVTPSAEGPYTAGEMLQLVVTSADPNVNGVASGLQGFKYWWVDDATVREVSSTGTATIRKTDENGVEQPLTNGRHVLYVQAVDKAGNLSATRTYTFVVGSDILAHPMATWRFEGDAFDDSGHDFDLTSVDGGTSFETDREGRADSALALDGSTCLSTDDGDPATVDSVVRTDAAFSVAAWLRVDNASGYDNALVGVGAEHSSFQLQYGADEDKWYFSMLSTPGSDFSWKSLGAPATAALGEWQHVAGTYDPDAGLMRIYIDGQLAGELPVNFTSWSQTYPIGIGCLLNASGGTANFVTGAIDQVGIWQGLLTPEQVQAAMADLPSASEQVRWEFRDRGKDSSPYGRGLIIPDGVTIGEDAFERPSGAVELDGATCLEYPEPVTATDRSFTVAVWARLDATTGHTSLVSIAGESTTAMRLRYSASVGKWVFMVTDQDSGAADWPQVQSTAAVEADRWYHLTGVFDATKSELRFYLDGQLQGTRTGVTSAWNATGPILVGCAGRQSDDYRWEHLAGSLHDVSIWRGAVDAVQIAEMMGDPPADGVAWWDLDSNGDDWTGSGHDLTLVDNYDWVRGEDGTRDGALAIALDGGGYGHTDGPVVATDESFTIGAWVNLDSLDTDQVAVSITGASRAVIELKYSQTNGAWEFAAPPDGTHTWRVANAATQPVAGVWTHLVGVFDLRAGELRLYVNGQLAGTATDVVMPASTGPVVIGAELNADGTIRDGLVGAVDRVQIWQGALPAATIAAPHLDPQES